MSSPPPAVARPAGMFDRGSEWENLTRFATSPKPGARLGVVYGRRRQGKTYLLRALCQATGGFYFGAEEATSAESLRMLGTALARHTDAIAPVHLDNWQDAVDALLRLGRDSATPVVLDEFPYLARAYPALPSTIQNALAPLRRERDESRTRLLLCGSAMSFMGGILSGNAPLRGRASLEMVVHTFDFRLARQYWSISDPALAVYLNAIVGGTPAYREYADKDSPQDMGDFDSWVARTVFNPAGALLREARHLMAGELDIRDPALYQSILAAIADGRVTRGAIANYLDRKSSDLTHPLNVLEDAGLIDREVDAFRSNRAIYQIAEPFIAFHNGIMRPMWSDLEHSQDPLRLWRQSRSRFTGKILGPHFERLCRRWTRFHATPKQLGDQPSWVGTGTINDQTAKQTHEVDVVARAREDDGKSPIMLLGEVKWGEVMGVPHLNRLRRVQVLLAARGDQDATRAKLACFGAAGFTDELRAEAAENPHVLLVSLDDLYNSGEPGS